tara:strand:+ start:33 stop:620 length:588 start_codon:yes stop_codon:yes gene_type:complete
MSRKFPKNALRSYVQTHAKHLFAYHPTLRQIKGVRITFAECTRFLDDVNTHRDKPDLCWMHYDSASRHEVDWVKDLQICLKWIPLDGVVLLVFPRRNNLSFLLQHIQAHGHLADIYTYQDGASHFLVLSVVKRIGNHPKLSRFATPQEGQRVKVKDHTGTWEGVVGTQYAGDEYEVYQGDTRYSVFRDEITHALP